MHNMAKQALAEPSRPVKEQRNSSRKFHPTTYKPLFRALYLQSLNGKIKMKSIHRLTGESWARHATSPSESLLMMKRAPKREDAQSGEKNEPSQVNERTAAAAADACFARVHFSFCPDATATTLLTCTFNQRRRERAGARARIYGAS